jgi:hypothetical protein
MLKVILDSRLTHSDGSRSKGHPKSLPRAEAGVKRRLV